MPFCFVLMQVFLNMLLKFYFIKFFLMETVANCVLSSGTLYLISVAQKALKWTFFKRFSSSFSKQHYHPTCHVTLHLNWASSLRGGWFALNREHFRGLSLIFTEKKKWRRNVMWRQPEGILSPVFLCLHHSVKVNWVLQPAVISVFFWWNGADNPALCEEGYRRYQELLVLT